MPKLTPAGLQNLGKGNGDFLARSSKDPEQPTKKRIFNVGIFRQSFHTKFLRPISAQMSADAPGLELFSMLR